MCTSNNQNLHVDAQVQLGDNRKLAYDKAIEGYQFQVGRYNTWMNYYAIFVGALFVALYNIWPSASVDCACCTCCKCHKAAVSNLDTWFLPLVISVLGLLTSICWYGALLGYRKWNGHWVGIVRECERNLAKPGNNTLNVYDNMPKKGLKGCIIERILNSIKKLFTCKRSTYYYVKGYVSTQKITGIFIIGIMIAWVAAFAFAIYKYNNDCCWAGKLAFGIGIAIMVVLLLCLHHLRCGAYCSKIVKNN